MKSMDELREYLAKLDDKDAVGYVDAIEREIAECYLKLPIGRDGRPIRPNDRVIDYDVERHVTAVSEDAICLSGYADGSYYRMGLACNHFHAGEDKEWCDRGKE